jgi:phage-related baseplate assembly protein
VGYEPELVRVGCEPLDVDALDPDPCVVVIEHDSVLAVGQGHARRLLKDVVVVVRDQRLRPNSERILDRLAWAEPEIADQEADAAGSVVSAQADPG